MIDQGVDGICILANYSEQFLLTDDERDTLLELCLAHVAGRVPVIVTCSHFSTRIAIERARRAEAAGARMLMLMPPYHGATLRADEAGVFEQFARVAEAVSIPIMVQDAPLSGVTLSVPFLARLAREVPLVRYFKIEVPGTAAKLRALIAAGGAAIAGPFDGEESITLMADLDAGATGTMPSALLPDLIKPVVRALSRRPARRGGRRVRAHPAAHQLREPPVRPARDQDGDEGRRRHRERRGAPSARAAAPADARRAARARRRAPAARAALGQEPLTAATLLDAARKLSRSLAKLEFPPPVAHVYDPHQYAWAPYEAYVTRYGASPKRVVLLGMNPGPFGMMQTGVPFGEIAAVRDWMGIRAPVDKPKREHPRRPIEGFDCARSEVSGRRLWGWAAQRFGAADAFFADWFVLNYCPLAFLEASGRNFTPDKLPAPLLREVHDACDAHLAVALTELVPGRMRSASAHSRRSGSARCSKAIASTARWRGGSGSDRSFIRARPARRRTAAGSKPPRRSSWRSACRCRATGRLRPFAQPLSAAVARTDAPWGRC